MSSEEWLAAPKRTALMDTKDCRICDKTIKKDQEYRAPTFNTSARAHETCVQEQAEMLGKLDTEAGVQ